MVVMLCLFAKAQQNLVPNPSFEDTIRCPIAAGDLQASPPWDRVGGTGVFNTFHECAIICCGVPENRSGSQYPRTGAAYLDISLVHNNHVLGFHAEGNFLGVELMDTLETDKRYNVEFYLSLQDSARFAGRNIGVYFSDERPPFGIEAEDLLAFEPQVRYEGDFLTDKEGWMRIDGSFIAEGGETYMTIGNFDGYFNSDTLNLYEGGVYPSIGYWEVAFYYIDDVSVVKDTTYFVGISPPTPQKGGLTIYPNPAAEVVEIGFKEGGQKRTEVLLIDALGKVVLEQRSYSERETISVTHLFNGVYTVVLKQKGIPVGRRKLIIQR